MDAPNPAPSSGNKLTLIMIAAGFIVTGLIVWAVYQPEQAKPLDLSNMTPEQAGEILVVRNGCAACHQPDSSFRAPILGASYGQEVTLEDGSTVIVDDAYLEESIATPSAKVRQGYQNIMPPYREALTSQERSLIVAYIKSLALKVQTP